MQKQKTEKSEKCSSIRKSIKKNNRKKQSTHSKANSTKISKHTIIRKKTEQTPQKKALTYSKKFKQNQISQTQNATKSRKTAKG